MQYQYCTTYSCKKTRTTFKLSEWKRQQWQWQWQRKKKKDKGKRFTSLKATWKYSRQSTKKQNPWSPLYIVNFWEWYENTETLKLQFLESLKKYFWKNVVLPYLSITIMFVLRALLSFEACGFWYNAWQCHWGLTWSGRYKVTAGFKSKSKGLKWKHCRSN